MQSNYLLYDELDKVFHSTIVDFTYTMFINEGKKLFYGVFFMVNGCL